MNYNKVMLLGNLTRDIETRSVGSGTVANFGLAVNRKFKTAAGEQREEVTFVDCEAWGKQAEVMAQYLSKGRPIFIEGRLKLDQWEDDDGTKRSKMRVVVEGFQFISGGGERTADDDGGRKVTDQKYRKVKAPSPESMAITDDDIPF